GAAGTARMARRDPAAPAVPRGRRAPAGPAAVALRVLVLAPAGGRRAALDRRGRGPGCRGRRHGRDPLRVLRPALPFRRRRDRGPVRRRRPPTGGAAQPPIGPGNVTGPAGPGGPVHGPFTAGDGLLRKHKPGRLSPRSTRELAGV